MALAPEYIEMLKLNLNNLNSNGFIQFKGDPLEIDTLSIAMELGEIAHVPGTLVVQNLVPSESKEKEASSYSGNFGMGEFPFHTDLAHWYKPPRFLLLRCIVPSSEVFTSVLQSEPLFSKENKNDLRRSLFRPRRRLDGRLSALRLFEKNFYRWDTLFLKPINNMAKSLQSRIENKIMESSPCKVVLEQKGDCVLIDNWNVFHARSAIPPEAENRKIERVYLSYLKG